MDFMMTKNRMAARVALALAAGAALAGCVPVALVGAVVLLWRLLTFHLYLLGGGAAFFLAVRQKRVAAGLEE